ncbi:MAG TPA: hypothetical protein PKC09_10890 [Paracoccus sp. (in: a-proteobacteria)]|uniref:hypothetical protein n=1 Tax=uncultured Paracoccus sp. TaxID=189685 RepID=UPI0026042FB7|nr:hypothetical protein [uncultured Paracoccus sp.]HMQ41768.1 hypothetical protein [Paracoccus sp. (in: a-proteobacteria)]HMR35891.1 hypothetical protein [Paracoccus sp. (in: a-proteobacteria)]
MIRLNLTAEPRWLDLTAGLRLQIAPVTTAIMAAARSDLAASDVPEDLPQEALAVTMAKAVARRVILDWQGVGDADGKPVPVTLEGIDALLDIWPVFEAFQRDCLAPHLMLDQEKNVSAPSPTGITAGATGTAKRAAKPARTARRG